MRSPRSFVLSLLSLPLLLALPAVVSAQVHTTGTSLLGTAQQPPALLTVTDGTFEAALRDRRLAREAERALLAPADHPMRTEPANLTDGFASSGFAQFMSSPAGRVLRVVAGAGMIAGGIAADSDLGTGVAVAGLVPLLAGAFDFCVLSPLFGGPLSGKAIRAAGN